jgi:hypothetical protein
MELCVAFVSAISFFKLTTSEKAVFLVVAPYSLVEFYQYLGGSSSFHNQDDK